VSVEVTLQSRRADEPHAAHGASVRPLPGVGAQVPGQRCRLGELLLTQDAVVWTFIAVHALVLLQRAQLGKLLAADVADQWKVVIPRVTVMCVTLQIGNSRERCTAVRTRVHRSYLATRDQASACLLRTAAAIQCGKYMIYSKTWNMALISHKVEKTCL